MSCRHDQDGSPRPAPHADCRFCGSEDSGAWKARKHSFGRGVEHYPRAAPRELQDVHVYYDYDRVHVACGGEPNEGQCAAPRLHHELYALWVGGVGCV